MFFLKLWRALKLGFRTMRNVLIRPFRAIIYRVRRAGNLSRQMTKAAPQVAKKLTKVKLKPENREDYFETKNAYIAKPVFLAAILLIIALGLLIYFIIWPLLLRYFFVAHIEASAQNAATHTGRAVLYYDAEKEHEMFAGRLEDGARTGEGKEYTEDGALIYEGEFRSNLYDGKGRLYDEAGGILYEGEFKEGAPHGQGTLYERGVRVYSGGFQNGVQEGIGKAYKDGEALIYEGGFSGGARSGQAKVYENGALVYEGGYYNSGYNGLGKLYYENGALKAEGTFSGGYLVGSGTEYYENGNIKYRGSFDMGEYALEGALFDERGKMLYKGAFSMGVYEGMGTLFYSGGGKHITGMFEGGEPMGEVRIYDESGAMLYAGGYENGAYQGEGRLYKSPANYIDAAFERGHIAGAASIYESGALLYQGGYQDGLYQGEGKLYNAFGEVLYAGRFALGIPDCLSLLNQSAQKIPALLGEDNYIVMEKEEGIYYVSTKYSMALFVNYASKEAESVIHRAYIYDAPLMRAYTLATLPQLTGHNVKNGMRATPVIDTVAVASGAHLYAGRAVTDAGYITAWAQNESDPVRLIEFMSLAPLPKKPQEEAETEGGEEAANEGAADKEE